MVEMARVSIFFIAARGRFFIVSEVVIFFIADRVSRLFIAGRGSFIIASRGDLVIRGRIQEREKQAGL
jgi:hypothetical protein